MAQSQARKAEEQRAEEKKAEEKPAAEEGLNRLAEEGSQRGVDGALKSMEGALTAAPGPSLGEGLKGREGSAKKCGDDDEARREVQTDLGIN